MKKKITITCIAVLAYAGIQAQQPIENPTLIKKVSDSAIVVSQQAVVPDGNVFYYYDNNNKLSGTFLPGQQVNWGSMAKKKQLDKQARAFKKVISENPPPPKNCFQIACPPNAPAGAVCWKCQ